MYKTLIKENIIPKTLSYKPCAVLMGSTGAGKTTLADKLCGTQHKTFGSVTKQLYRNDVYCGSNEFTLIDTPGTDVSVGAYKHAILLKEGLTATKINTIFLVIKYNSRFENLIDNYLEVNHIVSKYGKKIVVMISFMDASENPEDDFNVICESFEEECPEIANIIGFSQKSSKEELANLMYSCISSMSPEQLEISDEEFNLKFNIYQMRSQMKISYKEYQTEVNAIWKGFSNLIDSTTSQPPKNKDAIFLLIMKEFKNEIGKLLENYKEKHSGAIYQFHYYWFYNNIQCENIKICDKFVEKVLPLMSDNPFDYIKPPNSRTWCNIL